MRWVIFCSILLYLQLQYTNEFQSGRANDVDPHFARRTFSSLFVKLVFCDALRHKLTAPCACPIFWDQLEKEGSNTVTLQTSNSINQWKKRRRKITGSKFDQISFAALRVSFPFVTIQSFSVTCVGQRHGTKLLT